MKKSRIGAWILIVALLMQNIPLSVWASGEQGTSYFGAGQSTEGDAAKASSGNGQAAGQTEATEPAGTMPSTGTTDPAEITDPAGNGDLLTGGTGDLLTGSAGPWEGLEQESQQYELKGTIFVDEDQDGEYFRDEPAEPIVEGVGIRIYPAEAYDQGDKTVLAETFTDQEGAYCFSGLEEGVYRLEVYEPEGLEEDQGYQGLQPEDMTEKIESGIWDYEILLPGEEDSWLAAVPAFSLGEARELNIGIMKNELPEETNIQNRAALLNAGNQNENDDLLMALDDGALVVDYSEDAPFHLEAGESILEFAYQQTTGKNSIVIELPPFFKINTLPEATGITITQDNVERDLGELGKVSVVRVTLQIQSEESTAISGIIPISVGDYKGLSDMMRKADKASEIPMDTKITVYDSEKQVLEEKVIKNFSELKEGETVTPDITSRWWSPGADEVEVQFDETVTFYRQFEGDLSLLKYHYPVNEAKVLIPQDEGGRIDKVSLQRLNGSVGSGGVAVDYSGKNIIQVDGKNYFEVDITKDFVTDANINADIQWFFTQILFIDTGAYAPKDEYSFASAPIYLQYKSDGAIKQIEISSLGEMTYTVPDYRITGGCSYRNVKNHYFQGEKGSYPFTISNGSADYPHRDYENMTWEYEFPHAIQPETITKLPEGVKKISISYADGETAKEITTPANLPIALIDENGGRVTKITLELEKVEKGKSYSWEVECNNLGEDEEGTPFTGETKQYILVTGKERQEQIFLSSEPIYLSQKGDSIRVSLSNKEQIVFTDETPDPAGFYESINNQYARAENVYVTFSKVGTGIEVYEELSIVFQMDQKPMSKVKGIIISPSFLEYAFSEKIELCYTTTKYEERSTAELEDIPPSTENYYGNSVTGGKRILIPELEEGEYVTGVRVCLGDVDAVKVMSNGNAKIGILFDTERTYHSDGANVEDESFSVEMKIESETNNKLNEERFRTGKVRFVNTLSTEIKKDEEENTITYPSNSVYQGGEASVRIRYLSVWTNNGDITGKRVMTPVTDNLTPVVYVEVLKGFALQSAGIVKSDRYGEYSELYDEGDLSLREVKTLENGNHLYIYFSDAIGSPVSALSLRLFVQPDVKAGIYRPIVNVAVNYEEYWEKYCRDESYAQSYPYEKIKIQDISALPIAWGIEGLNQNHVFDFSDSSDTLQIVNMTVGVAELYGGVKLIQGKNITFQEKDKENLLMEGIISNRGTDGIEDFLAEFMLGQEDGEIKGINSDGSEADFESQYTLSLKSGVESIIDRETEQPISSETYTVTYLLNSGEEIEKFPEDKPESVTGFRISLKTLPKGASYAVICPVKTEYIKQGEETEDISSYIGLKTWTEGESNVTYAYPVEYIYESYRIYPQAGVDVMENSTQIKDFLSGTRVKVTAYDEKDKEINSMSLNGPDDKNGMAVNIDAAYLTYTLEGADGYTYLPTKASSGNELLNTDITRGDAMKGQENSWRKDITVRELEEGTTNGKYDAFFICLPKFTLEDMELQEGKSKQAETAMNNPYTQSLNSAYTITFLGFDTEEDGKYAMENQTAEVTKQGMVTGIREGKTVLNASLTNRQEDVIYAKGNVVVSVEAKSPLPHVGGTGAGNFAFTGFILIAGGGAVAITRKRKKLPL